MGIGGEGQRAGAGAAPAGADRCGREARRGRAIVRDFRGEAGATGRGAGHAGCPRRHASKHQLPGHGRQPARAPGPPGRGGLPVPAASEWGRLRLLSQERSGKGARDALEKAAGTTADGSSGAPRPPAAPSSADGRRGRPPWDPPSEPRQTQTEGPGTQHLPGTLQMCRLGGGRRDGGAGSGRGAQGRGLGRRDEGWGAPHAAVLALSWPCRPPASQWPSLEDVRVGGWSGELSASAASTHLSLLSLETATTVCSPSACCVPGPPLRLSPASHRSAPKLRERRPWPEDSHLSAPPSCPQAQLHPLTLVRTHRCAAPRAPWAVPALGFGAVLLQPLRVQRAPTCAATAGCRASGPPSGASGEGHAWKLLARCRQPRWPAGARRRRSRR